MFTLNAGFEMFYWIKSPHLKQLFKDFLAPPGSWFACRAASSRTGSRRPRPELTKGALKCQLSTFPKGTLQKTANTQAKCHQHVRSAKLAQLAAVEPNNSRGEPAGRIGTHRPSARSSSVHMRLGFGSGRLMQAPGTHESEINAFFPTSAAAGPLRPATRLASSMIGQARPVTPPPLADNFTAALALSELPGTPFQSSCRHQSRLKLLSPT